ncbi:MFS transporter [Solicola gregarius]|uniref:MFS transporter n=1 Tax=Solicola gregarius TaxID=2908642 RepID=A0AA46TG24_9ACTN|nr:MFS transporter [Solicola gregarius]UYM04702.1 MFS transporter [Solicola gregarius]
MSSPHRSGVRDALASSAYRWLVLGGAITRFGNGIAPVALAFGVIDLGGDAGDLGTVVALYALADVVTVLFGGVLGDRLPRQFLMVGTAALAAATQAIAAVSLIGGWATIPLLGLLGMLNGALGALNGPSSMAITKQTIPETCLQVAVAFRRTLNNTAQIVAYGFAGVLVAWVGPGWALAVDAITFGLGALCYTRIRVPSIAVAATQSLLIEMRAGLKEVFRHTWLWLLTAQAFTYHLFYGGAQDVLGPIVVSGELGRPAWGFTLAAMMSGFLVGGVVTLAWRPRRPLYVGVCLLGLTAAFPAAMAVSDSMAVIAVCAFAHGFGLEIFSVGLDLSIQQNIAEHMLSRVYAFDMAGSFVARPLGLALTGPVAAYFGLRTWLGVVATVMAVSVAVALFSPAVRGLQRREPEPAARVPEAQPG